MMRKAVCLFALGFLVLPVSAHAGWKDLYRGLIPGNGGDQGRARAPASASPLSGVGSPFSAGSTYQQREAARKAAAQERRDAYRKQAEARVVAEQEAAQKAMEQAALKAERKAEARMQATPQRPLRVVAPGAQNDSGADSARPQAGLPSFISPGPATQKPKAADPALSWPYRAD